MNQKNIRISLNPFYSGLYFQPIAQINAYLDDIKVSIPSIQVCISNFMENSKSCCQRRLGLNPFYSGLYFQHLSKILRKEPLWNCLNPFYSGLYFQPEGKLIYGDESNIGLNPFYSGLYFQHGKQQKLLSTEIGQSQSLLFRSVFPTH